MDTMWDPIINGAIAAAEATGKPVAEVPLDEIARRAGISRATLFRRIGTRRALDDAVRARGIDPGGRPDVRARATAAAADLIEANGLAAMTLEAVAERAGCSVQALYSQIGGRDALLVATLNRFAPLPKIEAAFVEPPADLETGVRLVYGIVFDTVDAHRALLVACIADAANRPDGPVAHLLLDTYLQRAIGMVGGWLQSEIDAGRLRALPRSLVVQLFVAPIALHVLARPLVRRVTGEVVPREEAIEQLTQAFLRSVAPDPDRG